MKKILGKNFRIFKQDNVVVCKATKELTFLKMFIHNHEPDLVKKQLIRNYKNIDKAYQV